MQFIWYSFFLFPPPPPPFSCSPPPSFNGDCKFYLDRPTSLLTLSIKINPEVDDLLGLLLECGKKKEIQYLKRRYLPKMIEFPPWSQSQAMGVLFTFQSFSPSQWKPQADGLVFPVHLTAGKKGASLSYCICQKVLLQDDPATAREPSRGQEGS